MIVTSGTGRVRGTGTDVDVGALVHIDKPRQL